MDKYTARIRFEDAADSVHRVQTECLEEKIRFADIAARYVLPMGAAMLHLMRSAQTGSPAIEYRELQHAREYLREGYALVEDGSSFKPRDVDLPFVAAVLLYLSQSQKSNELTKLITLPGSTEKQWVRGRGLCFAIDLNMVDWTIQAIDEHCLELLELPVVKEMDQKLKKQSASDGEARPPTAMDLAVRQEMFLKHKWTPEIEE